MKKKMVTVLAIVLVVALSVAGTYAYLTAQTDSVKNTFAMAGLLDGDLVLDESTAVKGADGSYTLDTAKRTNANSYDVVPGVDLPKDPTVSFTLKANIDAYVFLAVDNNLNGGLTATIDSTVWGQKLTTYTDANGVEWDIYAKAVSGAAADTAYTLNVLADQTVVVPATATGDMGDIVFNAYLTQAGGFEDAADAWANTFGATK